MRKEEEAFTKEVENLRSDKEINEAINEYHGKGIDIPRDGFTEVNGPLNK